MVNVSTLVIKPMPIKSRPELSNLSELLPYISNGPVAQLVERIHGMDEAVGSIPIRSTFAYTYGCATLFAEAHMKTIEEAREFMKQCRKQLTQEQWDEIVSLVKKYEFPLELVHGAYGFALNIYDHSPMPEIKPDLLIQIEDMEFPFPSAKKGFAGQADTLRLLEPLTHSKRNTEILAWYRFRPLSPVLSYEY